MNKLITKIVGAALGLTMAIGVGVAVGASREAMRVDASADTGYTAATMTAGTNGSACTVNDNDGIKVGTSKKGGDMTVTVPSGATDLRIYAAAWKGVTGLSLNITKVDGAASATISQSSIELTADDGISNNSPFTLSGTESSFRFDFTLTNITSDTVYKFTSSTEKRFVVWSAQTKASTSSDVVEVTGVTVSGITNNSTISDASYGDTRNLTATVSYTQGSGYEDGDGSVTWSSDDEDIATVESDGVVTFVGNGQVTITATSSEDNNYSGTVTFTLENIVAPKVVTYTINSKTSVATTGLTPIGSSATYAQTYSTQGQATSGNTITLTISDFSKGITIKSIVMNMKSNSSSGAGGLTYTADGGDAQTLVAASTGFNSWGDNTSYGTTYRDVTVGSSLSIDVSTSFVLTLSCSTNSLYVSNFQIEFEYAEPSISSSLANLDVSTSASKNITLTVANYSSTPTITYNVTSGASSIASVTGYDSISNNQATVSITASSTTGDAVIRFTATYSTETSYVDVNVSVSEPKTLSTLVVQTPGTTSFKEGDAFAVGSLVLRATFSDSSTTDYSSAEGNLALITFDPAIGDTLETSDDTVTAYVTEYGNSVTAQYSITVSALVWYNKVTDVSQLYDGQKIVIGRSDEDRLATTYSSGNNIPNEGATFDTVNHRIDENNVAAKHIYSVERLYVDDATVYALKDSAGKYIYSAGGTSNNYLKTKSTIDSLCYWNITITDGVFSIVNVGNTGSGARNVMCWNGTTFANYSSLGSYHTVVLYCLDSTAAAPSVASAFETNRMHMSDYDPELATEGTNDGAGTCTTYYPLAKQVWNAMSTTERGAVSTNAKNRLAAWAAANGDSFDGGTGALAAARIVPLINVVSGGNAATVIIIISVVSLTAVGGYFFLKKRKEQ